MTDSTLARRIAPLIAELLDEADKASGGTVVVQLVLSVGTLEDHGEEIWTHRWEVLEPYGETAEITHCQHRGFARPTRPKM